MPLIINEKKVEKALGVDDFVKEFVHFKDSSETLLQQPVKTVGPHKLLYIGQRELAGTSPEDDVISVIGSEDATTCHIAIIRHTGSGAVSLVHFDGSSIAQGLETMVSIVMDLTDNPESGRLEMHLVGGFLDDKKNSHEVSDEVLEAIHQSTHDIHLITACITHFNTVYRDNIPFPVIYGVAFDVKSGELHRATFPDKGPDLALRSARHFTGGKENINVYDPRQKELTIGPFDYRTWPHAKSCLSLPDEYIRKYLSTSPAQEPDGFVESVRASMVQLIDFPNPMQTVFKGGKGKRYKKDAETGNWVLLK